MSANNNNPKIAVIGCGNWGKNLMRVLHQLGALCTVCDVDSTKAAEFSEKYQVPFLSFEKILSLTEVDGLVIATPSITHFELGMAALKANKHVFIEKPLTLQVENAQLLHQLAKQQQRVLMVGHLLQYHSVFNTVKKLKQEGILGQLQTIYCNRLNFGKFGSEESVLWDYAPHDVSMTLALVDDLPTQILATSTKHLHHTSVDSARIHLHFESNIQAHLFVSWLYPFKEQKMIVVGSKAMVVFDDCQPWENKLMLSRYPTEWVDGLPHPFPYVAEKVTVEYTEPLKNECSHFLDCIQHNLPPQTNGMEGINVLTVLEAAEQSMTTHLPVNLPRSKQEISKKPDIILSEKALEEAI